MNKWQVLLITSILLLNLLFLLPALIFTPVEALDYGMDQDLGNVDASFWGENPKDLAGCSVASAGDVNGDGYDDVLIGACCNDDGGEEAGQTYLIFGKASGWDMDFDLSDSDASFRGEFEYDRSGFSVAGAGDVNGDGYDDILIGAIWNSDGGDHAGQTYLIFGRASGWGMDTDLSASDASFRGVERDDQSGYSVAGAGDVNGDGYDDFLIGAPGDYYNDKGRTYLIFGKASGWNMKSDLSTSDASFLGEVEGDHSGSSIAGAGDINGDGYDDILIGAVNNDEGGYGAGQTYLIFGKESGWSLGTNLSTSDASFWGEGEYDCSGISVAGAGDVNADGYDDILIGAPGVFYYTRGHTYLILGKSDGWGMDTNLSTSDASFMGEYQGDMAGRSVGGAGDVNGDGYDDILIGEYDDWFGRPGQTYLIFGKESGWVIGTNLSASDASFLGENAGDHSGFSVAGAGDVNRDGCSDLLIGAPGEDSGFSEKPGLTYLILGKNPCGLKDLSGSNASFLGEAEIDTSGYSVAGAGDVNGDGYSDILLGAYENGDCAFLAGHTYLILGNPSGWAMDTDLSASDASFFGETEYDYSGCSVAGAGDVNGDGYDDILIGAEGNGENGWQTGQTYLIFGKPSGWSMDTNLSVSNASFRGENYRDFSGCSGAGAGDVNGDGYDDILIGATGNHISNVDNEDVIYLILGKATGWSVDTNLSTSDASFIGVDDGEYSKCSIAGAGDINGDRYDDILIGAHYGSSGSSKTYLIFGKTSGWAINTNISSSDVVFNGEESGDMSGCSVAGIGDVNGDGYDDILIGAYGNDEGGDQAGQTYLIFPVYNSRPILYNDSLSPTFGNTLTNFTFSITYYDLDGDEPVDIKLNVDGNWFILTNNKSKQIDFKMGVTYTYTLKFTEGFHRYYYYVSDGKTEVRFPRDCPFTTPFIQHIPEVKIETDSDNDGYNDSYESEKGSDPFNETSIPHDWDGDGWNNTMETGSGSDPRNSSSVPRDQDADGIPDHLDPDRDGDNVANVDDPYPVDPTRWEDDSVPDEESDRAVFIWVGLMLFMFVVGVSVLVSHVVRKKRVEEGKRGEKRGK